MKMPWNVVVRSKKGKMTRSAALPKMSEVLKGGTENVVFEEIWCLI